MTRLMLGAVAGMIAALLISDFITDRLLEEEPTNAEFDALLVNDLQGGLVLAAILVEDSYEYEWDEICDELSEIFGYDVTIVPDSEVPVFIGGRLARGELGVVSESEEGLLIWTALSYEAKGNALRFGPLPDSYEITDEVAGTLVLASMVGVFSLAALVIFTPLVRRLRDLEKATQRLASGDFSSRAKVSGKDAITDVAQRFNDMAATIERLLRGQTELIQAVSHELRTPLARIRFRLELLTTAKLESDRQTRLDEIDRDLEELDELIEELLTLIRSSEVAPKMGRVSLQPTLQQCQTQCQALRSDIALKIKEGDHADISADPVWFSRALTNLLKNAVRHAKSAVSVSIEHVSLNGEAAIAIRVDDDGPGVPKHLREAVFDPFFRTDLSRDRTSGGVGLGLAIVQRVADAHGASIKVHQGPLGGARFELIWPIEAPTEA